MKRLIPGMLLCALIFICSLGKGVYAKEEEIEIPGPGQVVYQTEEWNGDSALRAVFAVPEEFHRLLSMRLEECKERFGYEEFAGYIIFDWSVDRDDGWHYTPNWEPEKGLQAPLYAKLNEKMIQEAEVFWLSYPGQQVLLKEYITSADGKKENKFQFEKHTLYIRAKFLLVFRNGEGKEKRISSGWSGITRIGQGYQLIFEEEGIPAPNLSSVQRNKVRGKEGLSFRINYPDELTQSILKVQALYGSDLNLEAQVRENGGNWKNAEVVDGNKPYQYEEREVFLNEQGQSEDYGAELRVRYYFKGNKERDRKAFWTPWSQTIAIGKDYWDNEDKDARTAMAEAAKQEMREYSIAMLGILLLFSLILLFLLIKKPNKKNKIGKKENT